MSWRKKEQVLGGTRWDIMPEPLNLSQTPWTCVQGIS